LTKKYISPNDVAGVALAAIQGLHGLLQEKDRQIDQLSEGLAAIEAALENNEEPKAVSPISSGAD
jgi:hypothetical protein